MHEALDQIGALLGPLTVAGVLALTGDDYAPLAVALPVVAAIALLVWLRARVPDPVTCETRAEPAARSAVARRPEAAARLLGVPGLHRRGIDGPRHLRCPLLPPGDPHLQYAAAMRTPWRRWPPAGATTASDPAS
ncbi:hypothetical protein SALBM311S_09530 [Streptomyces alboniger]